MSTSTIYRSMAEAAMERRTALVAEARTVAEDKGLTVTQRRERLESINAEVAAATDEARQAIADGEREAEVRRLAAGAGRLVGGSGTAAEVRANAPLPAGAGFADLSGVAPSTATEFGEYARSLVYEGRAASEGTDSAGGFLVPTKYAAGVLDLARNRTRVIQAGASVVPLDSDDVRLAKVASDPSAGWRNESSAIAISDIAFGEVRFQAKSLAVLVKASWELLEDAENFGQILQTSLAESFAVKVDSAALYGSGIAPEPLGLKNTAGVTITPLATNGAALTTWDPIISAVSAVRTANFEPSGVIHSERTAAKLASFKDSAGSYLTAPEYVRDVPRYSTGNVPNNLTVGTSGAVTSDIFVGAWENLYVGIRTNFQLKTLTETFASTGEVGFVGWLRSDIQVARPGAFQIVSGINGN